MLFTVAASSRANESGLAHKSDMIIAGLHDRFDELRVRHASVMLGIPIIECRFIRRLIKETNDVQQDVDLCLCLCGELSALCEVFKRFALTQAFVHLSFPEITARLVIAAT